MNRSYSSFHGVRGRRLLSLLAVILLTACQEPTRSSAPAQIEISSPAEFLEIGQRLLLLATVKDGSGRVLEASQVNWTSTNPGVARVTNGLVTGRIRGVVFIKASVGELSDSVRLTVEQSLVGGLAVWPDTLTLIRGRGWILSVEVRDRLGRHMAHPVVFSSSSPEIASVTGSGEIQGRSLGSAVVTLTAGLKSAQVPVRVVTGERYRVVPLGTLGGSSDANSPGSLARDINNRGEIVGNARAASGSQNAFLWRKGRMLEVAPPPSGSPLSTAVAVNDSGTVVGYTMIEPNSVNYRADGWRWSKGTLSPLRGISTWGRLPADINNQDVAVVNTIAPDAPESSSGSIWEGGRYSPLPGLPVAHVGQVVASINDQGMLAVNALHGCVKCPVQPHFRAFFLSLEKRVYLPILPPDTFGMQWWASEINEQGQVVGGYGSRGGGRNVAFLWEGGKFTPLPSLPAAVGINRYGDILGSSPASLLRGGRVFTLNEVAATPEWEILEARGINDLGQIVAQGKDRRTGAVEALLLTPDS